MWPEAARRVRASPRSSLRTRRAARREARGRPRVAAWSSASRIAVSRSAGADGGAGGPCGPAAGGGRAVWPQAKRPPKPRRALAAGHGAAVLAGVVDDGDGEVVGALQLAQVAEDRGDIAGLIFVDAMEPDEGVEQEQGRGR